jgi:Rrf2 family protein
MLNKSAKYALRAVAYLAVAAPDGDRPVPIQEIATSLGVPKNYLSKVTYRLARAGVLRSTRGPSGGFALAVAAERLPLCRVTEPFDPTGGPLPCLLRDQPCNPADPCVAHERWKELAAELRDFFEQTTVGELLEGRESGTAVRLELEV